MFQETNISKGFEPAPSGNVAAPYGILASIQPVLDKFSPPTERLDPKGSWKHSYAIWLEDEGDPNGYIEIQREASAAGVSLAIDSVVTQTTGTAQTTKAKILCAADLLCTPKSWQVESAFLGVSGQPMAATRLTLSAAVKGSVIESQSGKRRRQTKAPLPFTSNWSLFEAIQRLPGSGMTPLRFALLEDLDLVKPNQRLSFCGKTTVSVAGGKHLELSGYEQTGDGVLPFHYWVDEQRRLLFALSGTRAYIWDPEARKHRGVGARNKGRGEG
jgi:hypothetical protein